jgi:DNA modification methylase
MLSPQSGKLAKHSDSATTGVAALEANRRFIGIEKRAEFAKKARCRIDEGLFTRKAG